MIVVIVLGLLCLILIVYVLFNTSDGFRSGTECLQQGGRCVEGTRCAAGGETGLGCPGDAPVCCPVQQVRP